MPQDVRSKILLTMHENYENAKYVVVHDQELLSSEWSEDGTPLNALAGSSWFTRAWTAVELHATCKAPLGKNVKVLFKIQIIVGLL